MPGKQTEAGLCIKAWGRHFYSEEREDSCIRSGTELPLKTSFKTKQPRNPTHKYTDTFKNIVYVSQTVKHGSSNTNVKGLIPRE